MKNKESKIEIPFGANDSELCECEYTIPSGCVAEIKDGKVIIRKVESEDEKIRKVLIDYFLRYKEQEDCGVKTFYGISTYNILAYLEKKGEQKPPKYSLEQAAGIFLDALSLSPYNNKPITDAQIITKELLKFLSDASSYNPDALNNEPAGCDEEYNEHLSLIVPILSEAIDRATTTQYKDEIKGHINWLKFRLPQKISNVERNEKNFKPSEEMLEALYRALPKNVKEISEDELLLDKLYQGLKYGRVIIHH